MIQERIDDLSALPEQLKTQLDQNLRKARRWFWDAREKAALKTFETHVAALDRATALAAQAGEYAGEQAGETAKSLVGAFEKATIAPPVAGYDEMNVREAMASLREIDRYGLLRVERYESAHKARKTVLDAISREVDRRARLAELGA